LEPLFEVCNFAGANQMWNNIPPTVQNCAAMTGEAKRQCLCDQGTCTDIMYYFRPDHLGSSTFMTDFFGNTYEIVKKK
jgi:hypothetical protein